MFQTLYMFACDIFALLQCVYYCSHSVVFISIYYIIFYR